ncbi:hypothetical protein M758_6G059400 [Ceratodon purpureus]|nr:hypothetical protein M758_6G059400 [Ceratodon purpureus]
MSDFSWISFRTLFKIKMTSFLVSWFLDSLALPLLKAFGLDESMDGNDVLEKVPIALSQDGVGDSVQDSSSSLHMDDGRRKSVFRTVYETACAEGLTVVGSSQVTFEDRLSKGGQGTVYAGTFQVTSECNSFLKPFVVCIAVKKFKRGMRGISPNQIPRGLWTTSCVHVCRPFGVFFAKNSDCMVMPRYSRDLRTEIESRMNLTDTESSTPVDRPFAELVSIHIIMQLALGLKGLHDCGVYHRDIKAANILVNPYRNSEFYEVAIADFEGAADSVGAGTQYWRAPEVLKTKGTTVPLAGHHWQAADVYSFGMTCYEILTGKKPLDGLKMTGADCDLVKEGKIRPELPNHVPELLRDIISRCWLHDPASRPSLDDVLDSLEKVDNHRLARANLGIPRSFMKLPDSNRDLPESPRPTLSHILSAPQSHEPGSERLTNFSFWASDYISTQEQFVSQFEMKAHLQNTNAHDSLTFAEFVERRRSLAFIRLQKDGSGHNIEVTKDEYSKSGPIRVEARMCGSKILLPSEGFRRFSSSPPAGCIR